MKQQQYAQPQRKAPDSREPQAAPTEARIDGNGVITRRWPILALAGFTFLLSLPLFAPWSIWPLGYVVLVPWLIAVCMSSRAGWTYLVSYLLGTTFFLWHWEWLYDTTAPGYIAGSLYFAAYFPLTAFALRHLHLRRGLSVTFALPIVWTMTELMRSRGPLGFPWFLLGHSQIRLSSMVQLADLTGVYGVSFVVAAVNGWFVDLLNRMIKTRSSTAHRAVAHEDGARLRKWANPIATALMLLAVGAAFGYGQFRLHTMQIVEGPKVAVLQGDFLLSPNEDANAPSDADKQGAYLKLMRAAANDSPDMVVLPETPWFMYLNREFRDLTPDAFRDLSSEKRDDMLFLMRESQFWHKGYSNYARQQQCYIVAGAMGFEKQHAGDYPAELRYNSAFIYAPGESEPMRYDKIHLVLFGEFVPFRYNSFLHPLYLWLNSITPWGADGSEYSLTSGRQFRVFPMHYKAQTEPEAQARAASQTETRHFGITICYEDVIPHLFRRFTLDSAGNKRIDFMLNISNDGWFGHGSQQSQHLVNCAFRAIENRVGIARAVNTGVSGFISPDGTWYDLVGDAESAPHAGGAGHRTARVKFDPRVTFYARYGDVFGVVCALLGWAVIADAMIAGWQIRRRERVET